MQSIITIAEQNGLDQIIPTEKKRQIKSGFLNYEETIKKGAHFIQDQSCDKFYPKHYFSWDSKSTLPDVFSLNKPQNSNQLMNCMTHQQPCDKPFGLNFEIPRLQETNFMTSFLTSRSIQESCVITSLSNEQQNKQEELENESNQTSFFELCQVQLPKRPKYWEDLDPNLKNQPIVELQNIHISQKYETINQLKCQGLYIITQKEYLNYIQQMLLGFQNQYFIFDTDLFGYQQLKTIYVEDITCLTEITHKFIKLADYAQKLRFYQLKPSNNILRNKMNLIIRSFIDEFESKILEIMILNQNITILEFQITTIMLLPQLQTLDNIFTIDDCSGVNKVLYEQVIQQNQNNQFLLEPFYQLNNFQLEIFAKGINSQIIELQIPQHFPYQFSQTYANTVQSLALLTQLKSIKLFEVEEILEICKIDNLQLQSNIKQKYLQLKNIYNSKESSLKQITKQFRKVKAEEKKILQQKRKEEFERIQKQVRIQQKRVLNSVNAKKQILKNEQDQLMIQIEVKRINRKYQKLIEQQEERNLLLEQELKEKQILKEEKEKLLNELTGLGVQLTINTTNQVELELNPTPIQLMNKELIDKIIEESPIEYNNQNNKIQEETYQQSNQVEINIKEEQQIMDEKQQVSKNQPENEVLLEEITKQQLDDDSYTSIQLQLEICVGIHAKLHNNLVNKSIHFILFEQLGFLDQWEKIKKYYFTCDGDSIDTNIFQLIDSQNFFVPHSLTTIDIVPKLKSKSKLTREKQGFYECNIHELLQIKIESKAQILKVCFTNSVLQQILIFFDQIIKLRYCSYNLRLQWKYIHKFKDHKIANSYGMLRYQMQTFVDIYQNYIFYDVIESTWYEFKKQLQMAKTLEEIIAIESNYMNKILETTLLQSEKKIIKESYTQCLQMINQFIQILDFQYNFGLIQKQPPDISKLSQNFKKQSDFFGKFIKWLRDPTTFDKPI